MRILFTYLKKYRGRVILALFLATVNQCFSLLDPQIFRHILDDYVSKHQQFTGAEFFRGVSLLLLAAVGVAFVSRVAKNFQDYVVNVITQRLGAEMYTDGLRHSLELPYQVFEDQRSGETLGILQKMRTDVERIISTGVNFLFTTLVGVVFVTIYSISVHWLIAPVYFSTVPLLAGMSAILSRKVKKVQKQIVTESAALAGSTTESLRNIELVKSLGLANQEILRLNGTTERILALELKKVRYLRSLSFIQGTCVNALRTGILGLMLYLIFAQEISFGQFFALWIYSFFIFGPLQEMGNVINIFRESEASLNNFQRILSTPRDARPAHPVPAGPIERIAFEDVTFRYGEESDPVLRDVSFVAEPGQTVAVLGATGAGKSTLVHLIGRFYDVASGGVTLDGVDVRALDEASLRRAIAIALQESVLFSGTIRDNIRYGRPDATDAEVEAAARAAQAHDFITAFADGYDTIVGQRGVNLSGGQKQRIAIARALLVRPAVLILDDSTSSVDVETEAEIQAALAALMRGAAAEPGEGWAERVQLLRRPARDGGDGATMTAFVIAQRISTVLNADKILVLDGGRIAAEGTHAELLASSPIYREIYDSQLGNGRATCGSD